MTTSGEGRTRAAVYARVSSLDQNPDLQLRELRQYAARRGWEVREFVDHGVSGAETRRPWLTSLQQSLNRREFDVLLVWKFDRVFRSLQHMVAFCSELKHLKIEFISITEQVDTGSPQGQLMFNLLASFAQFERDLIRERVIAGLNAARSRGVVLGRKSLHKIDRQAVLKLIDQGLSYGAIAKKLGVSKTTIARIVHPRATVHPRPEDQSERRQKEREP